MRAAVWEPRCRGRWDGSGAGGGRGVPSPLRLGRTLGAGGSFGFPESQPLGSGCRGDLGGDFGAGSRGDESFSPQSGSWRHRGAPAGDDPPAGFVAPVVLLRVGGRSPDGTVTPLPARSPGTGVPARPVTQARWSFHCVPVGMVPMLTLDLQPYTAHIPGVRSSKSPACHRQWRYKGHIATASSR